MLHLPALWCFDTSVTYPQLFRRVKFVVIPPCFVWQQYLWNIAIQSALGCKSPWANLRCSSCSPLGENLCEMGLLTKTNPTTVQTLSSLVNMLFTSSGRFNNYHLIYCRHYPAILSDGWRPNRYLTPRSRQRAMCGRLVSFFGKSSQWVRWH